MQILINYILSIALILKRIGKLKKIEMERFFSLVINLSLFLLKYLVFQCHLAKEGAADLIVDLIMKETNHKIFQETVELGIALLEGGNPVIQVCISLCYKWGDDFVPAWYKIL